MSKIAKLKEATSLHDIANLLGFQPKALSYILYKKNSSQKYKEFEIPKRSGGSRKINAPYPDLKNLQKRLSSFLQDCIEEQDKSKKIRSEMSHGFKRYRSIITNAYKHRNKRYVLNIDLEDFFGTINYGRVRGFFIKDKSFELHPNTATVIAQIICFNNSLPQGSPCSPVMSNLIGHILDIKLAKLAKRESCTYSRYADDLTFSTNKKIFPRSLAIQSESNKSIWDIGVDLENTIRQAGFSINKSKTRVQYKDSRQDVTGLIVNRQVNTKIEYRKTARAMVHSLITKGSFQIKSIKKDVMGLEVTSTREGSLDELNGILSFIEMVSNHKNQNAKKDHLIKNTKIATYPIFKIYKDFHTSSRAVIMCEGKTDNIYIKAAIKQLAGQFPMLVGKDESQTKLTYKVKLYKYTKTTDRILGLAGGTGDLGKFIRAYSNICNRFNSSHNSEPLILLIDNDSGATGKGGIYTAIKDITGNKVNGDDPFYFVCHNLYVVPTPKIDFNESSIEDFFENSIKQTKLGSKTFNPKTGAQFDSKIHYGKHIFATHIIEPQQDKINFEAFVPILKNIEASIRDYKARVSIKK